MIRLQDIADRVGVSRTTVSNVLHGKTKRVSKETQDKIAAILKEEDYIPNMGSILLTKSSSKIIGVVLWYDRPHGRNFMQDPFINEMLGGMNDEIKNAGYYLMLIGGQDLQRVVDIASRWSIDGLVVLGLDEEGHIQLQKALNKPIVAIDTYFSKKTSLINISSDDFDGGYQMGQQFVKTGLHDAVYLTEYNKNADYYRWLGFKKAMEDSGIYCADNRNILVPSDQEMRLAFYKHILDKLLQKKALFCASDYLAIEAITFFQDHGIEVPTQISVAGYDDIANATLIRPQLTTIHQDIEVKGANAMRELINSIDGHRSDAPPPKMPVRLVVRNSLLSSAPL